MFGILKSKEEEKEVEEEEEKPTSLFISSPGFECALTPCSALLTLSVWFFFRRCVGYSTVPLFKAALNAAR